MREELCDQGVRRLEFARTADLAHQFSGTLFGGRHLFVECRDGRHRHFPEFLRPI